MMRKKTKRIICVMMSILVSVTALYYPQAVAADGSKTGPILVTQTVTEELSLDDFDVIGCSVYDADTHDNLKEYYISDDSKGATFTLGGTSGWSFLAYNLGSDKTLKSFEYDCNTSTTTLPISLGYARCRRSSNAYGEGFVGVYFNNWNGKHSQYHPYFLGSSEKPVVYESTDFGNVKTLAWQDGSNLTADLSGHTENYIVAGNYHVKFEYTGEKNEHTMTLTESTGTCKEITLSSPAIRDTTNVQNVQPDIPSLFFYKNYNYVSNIKITYTHKVDVTEQIGAIVEEHFIAGELASGITLDDIRAEEAHRYAQDALAYLEDYETYDEATKELLINTGYYDEALLRKISALVDLKVTEHVIPDYRKDVSLTTGDFTKVYESGTDSIWALQGNEQTSNLGKPVSFEYDVTYSQNNLPIALGYSNIYGNGSDREGYIFLNVYWRKAATTVQYAGYIAGQTTETYAPIDFESVSSDSVQIANNNAGSISEIGEAVKANQKLPIGKYHVCFQYEGNNAYTLTVTYLDEPSYYFVINSKAVDNAYEDVPSIRFTSAVKEISNIKVTYEGQKDMGSAVAYFADRHSEAKSFREAFVGEQTFDSQTTANTEGYVSKYLSTFDFQDEQALGELSRLQTAYDEASDDNLKKALIRYGYYNSDVVEFVLAYPNNVVIEALGSRLSVKETKDGEVVLSQFGFNFEQIKKSVRILSQTPAEYGVVAVPGSWSGDFASLKDAVKTLLEEGRSPEGVDASRWTVTKKKVGNANSIPNDYEVRIGNSENDAQTGDENTGKRVTVVAYIKTMDNEGGVHYYYSDARAYDSVANLLKNVLNNVYLADESNVKEGALVTDSKLDTAVKQIASSSGTTWTYADISALATKTYITTTTEREFLLELHKELHEFYTADDEYHLRNEEVENNEWIGGDY